MIFCLKVKLSTDTLCLMASRPTSHGSCAFTLDWTNHVLYAFPPLASYHNFFQKLEMDQAQAILIAPNWPTQPWYPQANKTLDSDATPPARIPSTIQPRTAPPPGGTASFDGLPLIRKSLQGIGISQATQDTILNSWRTATRKQYWVYLEKWQSFSPICKRCVGVSARTLSKGFRVQLSQHCKKCPIHLHSP